MGRWLREESRFLAQLSGQVTMWSQVRIAGGGADFPWLEVGGGGYRVSAEHGDTSVTTRGCCAGIYSNCWAAAAQHKGLQAMGLLLRTQELTVCRFSDNPGVTEANSESHREWGGREVSPSR